MLSPLPHPPALRSWFPLRHAHAAFLAAAMAALTPTVSAAVEPAYIVFGLGAYDFGNRDNRENKAVEFRLEYRPAISWWIVQPFVGAQATSDGAVYGFGGILANVNLGSRVVLTPSFAAGYYSQGSGKKLGNGVEFRSQIELAYKFENASKIGVTYGHISDAGINDVGGGVETLALIYAFPL